MSATIAIHPRHQRRLLVLGLAAVGVALAFLAGRATRVLPVAQASAASAPAFAPEAPRPWAAGGYRDDESWRTIGQSPDAD
jgi:hypothetical protein